MARRDNVKARKRLKKPKKIYTNTPLDKGHVKLKQSRGKVPAGFYRSGNRLKVERNNYATLEINVKSFKNKMPNKWGLAEGMSPQKLRAMHNRMQTLLISQRASPAYREKIQMHWKKYMSASYSYYYSKDEMKKHIALSIINEYERNPFLLGFRAGRKVDDNTRTAYILNVATPDQQSKNFDYYDFWAETELNEAGDYINYELDEDGQLFYTGENANTSDVTKFDDNYDWDVIYIYDVDNVVNIVRGMGGWTNAMSQYPADVSRLCGGAGYHWKQVYDWDVQGKPLPKPNIEAHLADGWEGGSGEGFISHKYRYENGKIEVDSKVADEYTYRRKKN